MFGLNFFYQLIIAQLTNGERPKLNQSISIQQLSKVSRPWLTWVCFLLGVLTCCNSADAQVQRDTQNQMFHLWNQRTPPGLAAQWAATAGKVVPNRLQPIEVLVPSTGTVTYYDYDSNQKRNLPTPAAAAISVGYVYRIRIADMPEYPGLEIYPSIEMIDQLHPPAGSEHKYPVPIRITEEEIAAVQQGRLVTKIVYLEQPQLVNPADIKQRIPVYTIPNYKNLMNEADFRGRPIAILRIGSRVPDKHQHDREFFGRGGPIKIRAAAAQNRPTAN